MLVLKNVRTGDTSVAGEPTVKMQSYRVLRVGSKKTPSCREGPVDGVLFGRAGCARLRSLCFLGEALALGLCGCSMATSDPW